MTTPHTVDTSLVDAPLINIAVFSTAPSTEEIKEAITGTFSGRAGEITPGKNPGSLVVPIDGAFVLHYQTIDSAPTPYSYGLHPILSADAGDLNTAGTQVLVSVLPDNQEHDLSHQFREPRREHLELLSQATSAVAQHANCLIIHNPRGNVSFSPAMFNDAVRNNLAPMHIAPVWITQSGGELRGYSMGLVQAGHPEIQARTSSMDPTDLYYKLANIADHILQGATVKGGDTLAFEEGQAPLTITEEPWFVDQNFPAVTIHF
ncbi:DUF4261 domain-containing protein [Corynebacterium accolens]|uniref:DUF4261 domain-containing protein n=1 Tax=Corynebacterium accolens TaxID=38284 RepID=UPI001EDAD173|nr:DUF4261 domain-containing protein [Corynebacterium accolens]